MEVTAAISIREARCKIALWQTKSPLTMPPISSTSALTEKRRSRMRQDGRSQSTWCRQTLGTTGLEKVGCNVAADSAATSMPAAGFLDGLFVGHGRGLHALHGQAVLVGKVSHGSRSMCFRSHPTAGNTECLARLVAGVTFLFRQIFRNRIGRLSLLPFLSLPVVDFPRAVRTHGGL